MAKAKEVIRSFPSALCRGKETPSSLSRLAVVVAVPALTAWNLPRVSLLASAPKAVAYCRPPRTRRSFQLKVRVFCRAV